MRANEPENFNHRQNTSGSIPNGIMSQSSLKTSRQVGTSTPKSIKRRLTFNILENHKKSNALDEISEENTRESIKKVIIESFNSIQPICFN